VTCTHKRSGEGASVDEACKPVRRGTILHDVHNPLFMMVLYHVLYVLTHRSVPTSLCQRTGQCSQGVCRHTPLAELGEHLCLAGRLTQLAHHYGRK
jgi:hypothetical protein